MGELCTDHSKAFIKACCELQWKYDKNTLGTATTMVQSGLRDEWWDCPIEGYCYLQNVHDKMTDVKTASVQIFGVHFDGPVIPFGAKLSYTTISSKDESRHQFGKQMLTGIFRKEGGQVTCSLQISKTGKNLSTSKVHVKEVSPRAGGTLKLFDLPRPRRGENPR